MWPWTLTPLTSRVLGAIFMLGIAGLGVLTDPRWTAARLMLQVQVIMLALILVAAARAHADFDGSKPLTWLLLGGFLAATVSAAVLSVVMDRRSRAPAPAPPAVAAVDAVGIGGIGGAGVNVTFELSPTGHAQGDRVRRPTRGRFR